MRTINFLSVPDTVSYLKLSLKRPHSYFKKRIVFKIEKRFILYIANIFRNKDYTLVK